MVKMMSNAMASANYTFNSRGFYAQLHAGAPETRDTAAISGFPNYNLNRSAIHSTFARPFVNWDRHINLDPDSADMKDLVINLYPTLPIQFSPWPSSANGETITHLTLWDTPTVGGTGGWVLTGTETCLWHTTLDAPITMATGDTFNLANFYVRFREDLS